MDFDVKLQGFKELAQQLKELPNNVARNALRAAVAAGAAEIRVEAKKNAQAMAKTGTLARAIYQKQIRELSSLEKQVFYVGVRKGKKYQRTGKRGKNLSRDAYYARFVEFGHMTRPSKSGKGHQHFVPPHPFLRPAFDSRKEAAVERMKEKLKERLEQFARGNK